MERHGEPRRREEGLGELSLPPSRCPFCHDSVAYEDRAWRVCARCLARHHTACWAEAGRCGTCGSAGALALASGSAPASASDARSVVVGFAVAVTVVLYLLVVVSPLVGEGRDGAAPQPPPAPAAAPPPAEGDHRSAPSRAELRRRWRLAEERADRSEREAAHLRGALRDLEARYAVADERPAGALEVAANLHSPVAISGLPGVTLRVSLGDAPGRVYVKARQYDRGLGAGWASAAGGPTFSVDGSTYRVQLAPWMSEVPVGSLGAWGAEGVSVPVWLVPLEGAPADAAGR